MCTRTTMTSDRRFRRVACAQSAAPDHVPRQASPAVGSEYDTIVKVAEVRPDAGPRRSVSHRGVDDDSFTNPNGRMLQISKPPHAA